MEQYNLTFSGEELDRAIGRAVEGFAKADEVTLEMEHCLRRYCLTGIGWGLTS